MKKNAVGSSMGTRNETLDTRQTEMIEEQDVAFFTKLAAGHCARKTQLVRPTESFWAG
jgi:hypothetical protein